MGIKNAEEEGNFCAYCGLDAIEEKFVQVKQSVALSLSIVYIERDASLLRVPYSDTNAGDPESGIIHGGVVTILLDSAGGCAVLSLTPNDHNIAALDLRIDYLQPAKKDEDIRGFAECCTRTHNLAFVRGVADHEDQADHVVNFIA